jgi:hypothetical protein
MKIDLNSQAKEAFATFAETGRITSDFLYHLGELNENIGDRLDKAWEILEYQRIAEKVDPYTRITTIDEWELVHDVFEIKASEGSRDPVYRFGRIPFDLFLNDDAQEAARQEALKLKKRQDAAKKAAKTRANAAERKRELKQLQALKKKYPDNV